VKRILVVDDERDNAYLFALILEDHGYQVDTYNDPIRALADFRIGHYDLIIVDYRMDDLNGLEFFQKIRSLDKSAEAILLTAGHEHLHLDDGHKFFLKILGKPIPARILLKEVALGLNN
jgi:CheY-like chemotaxis protein